MFFTPAGKALFDVAPPPELAPDPVQVLMRGSHERGIILDPWGTEPGWRWDRDISWE